MPEIDVVELTRDLVRLDTVNPPGDEVACADLLGGLLSDAGLDVRRHDHAPGRRSIVAHLRGRGEGAPLALSGHLDTVPFGKAPWVHDPLSAEIVDGRLYGRGSSDMKSGVAAMVACAVALAESRPERGLQVILTSGEETGCDGAAALAASGLLHPASALLVGEPTSNHPAIGHRGALWLRCVARGVTAHGSMPDQGVNAIRKAADAIVSLDHFAEAQAADPVLGAPTANIGTISGGINLNSVPDWAEFTVDLRTVSRSQHECQTALLRERLGPDIEMEPVVDLPPVNTPLESGFVQCTFEAASEILGISIEPRVLPFFTDAAILAPALTAPAVILGPGETKLAHQTDEYCEVERILQAVEIYRGIALRWCRG